MTLVFNIVRIQDQNTMLAFTSHKKETKYLLELSDMTKGSKVFLKLI